MSTNPTNARQHPSDEAGKLMSRADNAFRRGRMTLAYNLYGDAIARLEAMWDATDEEP